MKVLSASEVAAKTSMSVSIVRRLARDKSFQSRSHSPKTDMAGWSSMSMSGSASAFFASIMREVNMPSKNWFSNLSSWKWLERKYRVINQWHALHGRDYSEIMKVVPDYGPIGGWDEETKELVKLATKMWQNLQIVAITFLR